MKRNEWPMLITCDGGRVLVRKDRIDLFQDGNENGLYLDGDDLKRVVDAYLLLQQQSDKTASK